MIDSKHTREEAANEVFGCVEHIIGINREDITEDKNLIDDLAADSLDIVELVMEVEDTLGISIPEEDCKKVSTIRDLIDAAFKYWKDT